jgi:hypothetical protein
METKKNDFDPISRSAQWDTNSNLLQMKNPPPRRIVPSRREVRSFISACASCTSDARIKQVGFSLVDVPLSRPSLVCVAMSANLVVLLFAKCVWLDM